MQVPCRSPASGSDLAPCVTHPCGPDGIKEKKKNEIQLGDWLTLIKKNQICVTCEGTENWDTFSYSAARA